MTNKIKLFSINFYLFVIIFIHFRQKYEFKMIDTNRAFSK